MKKRESKIWIKTPSKVRELEFLIPPNQKYQMFFIKFFIIPLFEHNHPA
jgi:hypothetical protein